MFIDVCIPTRMKALPNPFYQNLLNMGFPINKLFLNNTEPLSKARMLLIKEATTEWFLFLDDDVILGKDWFKKVSKYLGKKEVGAIEGINLRKKKCLEIRKYERGLLMATLIRKSVVQDWIPRRGFESNFEDYDITQHVIRKGYRWLRVNVNGTHGVDIHQHASITGFEIFLSHAFTNKERLLYLIHILRIYTLSGVVSPKLFSNYVFSMRLWLRKYKFVR